MEIGLASLRASRRSSTCSLCRSALTRRACRFLHCLAGCENVTRSSASATDGFSTVASMWSVQSSRTGSMRRRRPVLAILAGPWLQVSVSTSFDELPLQWTRVLCSTSGREFVGVPRCDLHSSCKLLGLLEVQVLLRQQPFTYSAAADPTHKAIAESILQVIAYTHNSGQDGGVPQCTAQLTLRFAGPTCGTGSVAQ